MNLSFRSDPQIRDDGLWPSARAGSVDPVLINRADELRRGITDDELRRYRRTGELTRLRNGLYAPAAFADLDLVEQHRLTAVAVMRRLHPASALSHVSAAVLHGLPLHEVDLRKVHVTRPGSTTRQTRRSKYHALDLPPEDVTIIDDTRVTALRRTIVDLARTLPFEAAVVAGDVAMAELNCLPPPTPHHRGATAARRVLRFLDARSESVGESRSRVLMHEHAVAAPQLQLRLYDHLGKFLGRVDFCWPEFGVIGEFDGMGKYLRSLKPGQKPGDVVASEKHREDALRAEGWTVVRWTWAELETPEAIVGKLTRAFRRGRPHPAMVRSAG